VPDYMADLAQAKKEARSAYRGSKRLQFAYVMGFMSVRHGPQWNIQGPQGSEIGRGRGRAPGEAAIVPPYRDATVRSAPASVGGRSAPGARG
jgi:hypothetical protein